MKKYGVLLLALLLCVAVLAGCGGKKDNTSTAADDVTEIKGETYDVGNFSVLAPEGWMAIPVSDMWSDDADATDPDHVQICKGAESEWDILSHPFVDIVYYGADTSMMTPSSEWYEEVEDLGALQVGNYTWNGFSGISSGSALAVLWTGQDGDSQFQVTLWLETDEGSISVSDADVQAILASIQPNA